MKTLPWQGLTRRSLYALPVLAVNGLFTDGSAVTLSIAVGPPWASLLHWLLLAPWLCLVTWTLHHHILPDALAEWVERREAALGPRLQRLLRWGKGPAVLGLGAVFPLSGLLAVRLFGVAAPRRYVLAAAVAGAYCVVTTGLIYGGGWLLLQRLMAQFHS
ncbi:MAG TPA: hypothetical protein VFE37_01135 [Chloroflexota bacterium]|nr:hypothetical protein [Chloroflexota bacterium]